MCSAARSIDVNPLAVHVVNVTPGDALAGDPSGDGFVGLDDLDIILGNWNASSPPTDGANIPEPGAAAVMGLGVAMFLKKRTHHRGR